MPTVPPDRFAWNAGAWFGPVLGSTAWMLVAGVAVARVSPAVGATTLTLYATVNVLAVVLWLRRAALPCFVCLQFILVVIGLVSFIIVFIIDRSGHWSAIQLGGPRVPPVAMYVLIGLGVPAVVGVLWLQRWISSLPHTEDDGRA